MILSILSLALTSQSRLSGMPGAQEYKEAAKAARGLLEVPRLRQWVDNTHYSFMQGDKRYILDTQSLSVTEGKTGDKLFPRPWPQNPGRGRQYASVQPPSGRLKAEFVDGNIRITRKDSSPEWVTRDGSAVNRIKYGTASWVYGEELGQVDAMGFSPDERYLWYYRFDESKVLDYTLTTGMASVQNVVYAEAYPKPGHPNPIVDLLVYDVGTKKSVKVPVRPSEFDDNIGHYVYGINWDTDSRTLLFTRTNRVQNQMELCGFSIATSKTKVLYRESNPTGWLESYPIQVTNRSGQPTGAKKGDRVLFTTESSGSVNHSWLNLRTGDVTPFTKSRGDVASIVNISSDGSDGYYMAYPPDDDHHGQLFAISPRGDRKLTEAGFNHTVQISPDGKLFVDRQESSTSAPVLTLLDIQGKVLKTFAQTRGLEAMKAAGFTPDLRFPFKAADGTTTLYATIGFPRNFDRNRKYPALLDVYGGPLPPDWGAPSDRFHIGSGLADYGFLTITIDGRGTNGRGRAFRQAIFHNLGRVEIDDQAAGIRALRALPYFDSSRVGVTGTSYGGYASAMLLLRYPQLFSAACACSMVSDWQNYDTTYTERYMGLLPEERDSYKASAAATYAKNLSGYLMIYYGTADDNTHPSNSLQLMKALQAEGKSFEVQVGVDQGHSGVNQARMMEFFIERLRR